MKMAHTKSLKALRIKRSVPTFLDFFAGSGLVTEGMRGLFKAEWALDICPKKGAVYTANHGTEHFVLGDIGQVRGSDLPATDLAWASFPCQDLSLAGRIDGISGKRSGLVWQWLRAIDEMPRRPSVLVAENVLGLMAADGGLHYKALHEALRTRGYRSGAVVLNADRWLPQSRPRVFVISIPRRLDCSALSDGGPNWAHPPSVVRSAQGLRDWIWWKVPLPAGIPQKLHELIDHSAPCDDERASKRNLSLIPPKHQSRLLQELANGFKVAPGYRRTREGRQVLELRFDQTAGCLRTPNGGSSRQVLVLKRDGCLVTRLVSVREAARLMGAPETYKIPGSYNDGYKAMGDAVAVPVVSHLAKHLLTHLAKLANG